eukprot:9490714-Pyramimonas_sp.AAC.1
MGALLRRRDYAGATEAVASLSPEALTPKIRAMLATAAVYRERLDEALGQLRQIPVPEGGARAPLAPGS